MITKKLLAWLVLGALGLMVITCTPSAVSTPSPVVAPPVPPPAATATPMPASSTAIPATRLSTPQATAALPPPTAVATATSLPVAIDEEEECRKACPEIDINTLFGSGAKPLPATHKGYTVCLECHATLAKPALPATHVGRQDAACPLCHLAK